MWAVIVYPPLVVPVRIAVPSRCSQCGTASVPHVHEHLTRHLANIDQTLPSDENWNLTTDYETVRFRCGTCGKISMPPPPSVVPRFRFQRMIASRVLAAYSFGEAVDSILGGLEGISLSRATAYRFLETFADDEVEALRRENRRRARRARRRDLALGHYGYLRTETTGRRVRVQIGAEDDPEEQRTANMFLDVYRYVDVMRLYNDEPSEKTMHWLETYLSRQGSAGVLRATGLRDLERRFDPYELRLKKQLTYKLANEAMSETQVYGPLDTTLPVVRDTVAGALRVAIWWTREWKPGMEAKMPDHRLHNYP